MRVLAFRRCTGYPAAAACLGLASLLGSWGCTPLRVWLGSRVRLEKTSIASLQASFPQGPGIAPGQRIPLVVTITEPDGTVLRTEGAGKGKVLWQDLQVTSRVVSVSPQGIVTLPSDPRVSDGQLPHLTITVPSHPGIRTDLDLPLRYDHSFTADFSGSGGASGMDGLAGSDGLSGSPGSMDPNTPSPGGEGTNGSNGADGGDGGAGEDGPAVQVWVALRAGSHPLLQVAVSDTHREVFFLVDPQGGSLTVKADGGPGGAGGRGGPAGRGGSGGMGSPSGQNGSDGTAGRDGSDGGPGRAGTLTVTFDPRARPFLGALRLLNRDGAGRQGPPPVLREEPVAPLW